MRQIFKERLALGPCRWVRFCVLWKSVAGDNSIGREDDFDEFLLGPRWEGWLIGNGFDFQIFVVVQEIEAELLFGTDRFDGALDAGGQAIKFTHDVREEGDRSFEDVIDADTHGLVEEEFHLEESQLLVDELMDESDLGRGDWFELIEQVCDDRQGDVVIVDEAIEVGE